MEILTKEQILAAEDLETIRVSVEGWGGDVLLKPMTGKQRDAFEAFVQSRTKNEKLDMKGVRVRMIAQCLVDAEGELMFTTPEDMNALNSKSAKAINNLFDTVTKQNGIGDDELKDLEKNLEAAQKEDSGSDLPVK